MPLNSDGTVTFNATLFALVRTALKIKTEGVGGPSPGAGFPAGPARSSELKVGLGGLGEKQRADPGRGQVGLSGHPRVL